MRILIADDSNVSRTLLVRMLTRWGYDVVACDDGQSAWEALERPEAPRIALLDWVMPGLDGIEICKRLRAREDERYVFVYLLSARTSNEDMLEGLEAGADDYLTKPVGAAELRVRLRNGRRLIELHEELLRTRELMRALAMTDPLTQLYNRRAFVEVADKELSRSLRSSRPTSVLMIDIDHFKRVNDAHGHEAGDAVLREAAARIRATVRYGDHVARFGGEEFVALLPDCPAHDAFIVAERVRQRIGRTAFETGTATIACTTSIGVATHDGRESIADLVGRADRALYEAKHTGRDRSVLAKRARPGRGPWGERP